MSPCFDVSYRKQRTATEFRMRVIKMKAVELDTH
jgi:hypothetical protein